ncbi:hypothetical protein C8C99_4047 [Acidovorax sp. 107]|uniref:hypothetical protein n=1 Tax=Acidovorax sp. 107 TaxID=2135638 RepID=UPI000D3B6569|nr:hypothetical protein [Acidovorax sp. 107]PUA99164.1 hypothetical protein C8C99_4047 [Acidovorax sp. 107]
MRFISICAAVLALTGCVATAPQVKNSTEQPITMEGHRLEVGRFDTTGYRVGFYNTSPKAMKYVVFKATPFNKVGDPVRDTISGKVQAGMQIVGPLQPGEQKRGTFEHVWLNGSVHCVRLDEIEITYMDGAIETLTGGRVAAALGRWPLCAGANASAR